MKRASKAKSGTGPQSMTDGLKPVGLVEIFVCEGRPVLRLEDIRAARPGFPRIAGGHELDFTGCRLIDQMTIKNIIVNIGKDKVVTALVNGAVNPILRMAIGDRGTIPSDPTVPKTPVATMSALYNEVYRADIDAVTVNVGTPTVHEAKFIKTFAATDIPISSFSNQANPVINEVALITADPSLAPVFPRSPVAAPAAPPADEAMFSIRTYRSVPFVAANDISVTIRYTIFIE
jgi:hypothetical protein